MQIECEDYQEVSDALKKAQELKKQLQWQLDFTRDMLNTAKAREASLEREVATLRSMFMPVLQ
jgi:hypothetical protein